MKAVIFDMDGVLVDSEPLWSRAEREVFTALGVKMTESLCQLTQSMTTEAVTKFWFERNPWKDKSMKEVENMVIDQVISLIELEDCIIPGVVELIEKLKSEGFRLGLATNAPYRIIPVVLQKMNLSNHFEVLSSAEFEARGKPEPDIYVHTMQKLDVEGHQCWAVEDSNTGIKAAKKAGMKVMAFTDRGKNTIEEIVDFKIESFEEVNSKVFRKTGSEGDG